MTTTKTKTAQDRKFEAEARMFDEQARKARAEATLEEYKLRHNLHLEDEIKVSNDRLNIWHFVGEVDTETTLLTMRVMEKFARLRPEQGIELQITSPGGSILAGLALVDHIGALRRKYGVKVTTVALGMAASMAGILLQSGDTRVMGRESWMLIHKASLFTGGTYEQVMDTMDWLKQVQERIVNLFITRAEGKITREEFVDKWARRDWWLSSEDALQYGLIDEVR